MAQDAGDPTFVERSATYTAINMAVYAQGGTLVGTPANVPALSTAGLVLAAILLAASGLLLVRRAPSSPRQEAAGRGSAPTISATRSKS